MRIQRYMHIPLYLHSMELRSGSFCDVLLQRLLENGPVSFANYDSVAYISEQVSHHPPSKSQSFASHRAHAFQCMGMKL